MNENKLMKLLGMLELDYTHFRGKNFLNSQAIQYGAVSCVSIRDVLDVYFDQNNQIIGTATSEKDSFRKTPTIE